MSTSSRVRRFSLFPINSVARWIADRASSSLRWNRRISASNACPHASSLLSFWVRNSSTALRAQRFRFGAATLLQRGLREPRASERGGAFLANLLLYGQSLLLPASSAVEIPLRSQNGGDLSELGRHLRFVADDSIDRQRFFLQPPGARQIPAS